MTIVRNILAVIGAIAIVVAVVISVQLRYAASAGFSTREPPSSLEAWLAARVRRWVLPGELRGLKNPLTTTATVLHDARGHWADHCAGCHGNDGRGTDMGRHMYPPTPDMTKTETQDLSDGELYFFIQNGVRLSGMPAWGEAGNNDVGTWNRVALIRYLPHLTKAEREETEELNPRSPAEQLEEEDEKAFLQGGPSSNGHGSHK